MEAILAVGSSPVVEASRVVEASQVEEACLAVGSFLVVEACLVEEVARAGSFQAAEASPAEEATQVVMMEAFVRAVEDPAEAASVLAAACPAGLGTLAGEADRTD